MKCFYHNDMDGKCSAAIVYNCYKNNLTELIKPEDMFMMNYNIDFPFNVIKPDEQVYIVDYSLQKEGEFKKLLDITENVVWIDHHKTAIEKHESLNLRGVREIGTAGCVLTWKYFYKEKKVPTIVDMLGSYDVWDFSKYGEKLNKLQAFFNTCDTFPESTNWEDWLFDFDDENIDYCLKKGEVALRYRNNYYKDLIKSWSFTAEFEGYKAVCCNAGLVSSQLFDSFEGDYDLMMPFVFDGKTWNFSIYSKKDDIDCSELAKKYGGGGHKSASGFTIKDLPFKNIK